ncbi:NUDIX hydrolase [Enterococcus nangangensis]|uniref:NUDIX hydrolase n=1 Tax=Enterococcus nangangensis TaxID=2559926 RepID=UPI0010F5AE87|nr:NUDIX hydrolase [Enterococcus nangangensis]
MADYIREIRSLVGKRKIILNFVGACVFNDCGEVLLQRRSDKNKWGFPGGAVELGESLEETLLRELAEETGLYGQCQQLVGIYSKYTDTYPNGDSCQPITHLFQVKIISGTLILKNEESLELKFFPLNAFPSLVNQQHQDMYQDVLRGLDHAPFFH